ncbi:ventricular zone-expressed PH domain-containing protein [Osmerus eperlanus]|uniref:ventricular zone-expressed PH domain-containing protein n=1 Tax=Osmerus eperlanus TaxID=29151 RepID=UPI002E0D37B8
MHQLFSLVLAQRDLSRARDLFSLDDLEIEDGLSQALEEIKDITNLQDYRTNDNDQAVVEICITRITTAIRETSSIERHGLALVGLWESCLEHNLTPQGETEDTPHAKIASDITSCILQNYSRPPVMVLAVHVAVRFLQRGNRELSRNMSSYLSLAAIAKADLLAEHTQAITLSVLGGNHMLLRVLPSVYPKQPDAIHRHLGNLTAMMSQLESPEQKHLLRLIQMVAEQHPLILSPHVPVLVGYLSDPSLNEAVLCMLVDVSQASPSSLVSFLPTLRIVGQQSPSFLSHVAKIHRAVGIINEAWARSSLAYLVSLLGSMEHSLHHGLLLEVRGLTERHASILGGCSRDIYRMSNSFTAIARLLGRRLEQSKSLAAHTMRSRSVNSDSGHDEEGVELAEEKWEVDRLYVHLRDNMEKIKEFCSPMLRQIPIPEQCVIEDSNRGCVAKLSFSCPLKGHYCLYGKSCFNLTSRQPHLWINIMLLHLQSKSSSPLSSREQNVQRLASLWERTQLKGAHSFYMAMMQHPTPHKKDLDSLQIHLEEVHFFDLFGYSEDEAAWLCFMCNNPDKASVVNQEGQPLMEGKLKEKQVRWKFIKRWKTRYFTLAGNQLLFRKNKSKYELDDSPIELSKVQSVKVVVKKRRDCGLPRAFEIFTDNKTYVLKARDEKHAEEWLQCINVAVAQARERENREATTYL